MLVEFGHFRSVYMIDIQCSSTGCLQSRSREQKLRNFDLLLWKLDLFFRFIYLAFGMDDYLLFDHSWAHFWYAVRLNDE